MSNTPPTVRELIEVLTRLDPATPVIVSTHYDNDIGYASQITLRQSWMTPTEGDFWSEYDPADLRSLGEPQPPHGVRALVITATG